MSPWAIPAALAGALCYAFASAVQQHEAARAPATVRPGARLLMHLLTRPRWLAGVAATAAGAALHISALRLGPLAAYATLALLIGMECVGVPVPGETALIAAGALARDGSLSIVAVIAVAATAAILGDNVGYLVGRHGGRRLLSAPGPLHRHRLAVLTRGEPFFARHGAKAVFFGRWIAWARMGAPLLAGTTQMPWPQFARWNLLGGVAWAASVGLAAYLLGGVVDNVAANVALATALLTAAAMGTVIARRLVRRRRERASATLPTEPVRGRRAWRSGRDGGIRFGWVLAGCLIFALMLRAPYLGVPLGIDEGGLAYIAQNWTQNGDFLYGAHWLDRPPVLVLLFLIATLGGDLGVRLLGTLAAAALIVAVALMAREVAGERAGRIAALLAAVLSGSVAIHAVYTPAELLAVVPATISVLCLLCVLRRGQARWLIGAGCFAVAAALTKQSFLDAGVAGAAFLTVAAWRKAETGFRWSWPAAYLTGAAFPLLGLEAWEVVAGIGDGQVSYALLGFRLDAVRALAGSDIGLATRLTHLLLPALGSGLVLALAAATFGLRRLRRQPVVAVTLVAWLAGAGAGVLGGGSYWSHYLIQLVPATSVAAAIALAHLQPRARVLTLSTAAVVACAVALGGVIYLDARIPHDRERDVAAFVRASARPGDTQYVLYARANVLYYTGLPSPYPYAWSLMIRARPGARDRLYHLLTSTRRPTWLVQWQDDDQWQLDRGEAIDRILSSRYRRVATVCGFPVYLRTDRPAPATAPRYDCGDRTT